MLDWKRDALFHTAHQYCRLRLLPIDELSYVEHCVYGARRSRLHNIICNLLDADREVVEHAFAKVESQFGFRVDGGYLVDGSAPFFKSTEKHEVTPVAIVLNSSCKLTLHGWIEAMLHEMIHVSDYLLNPNSYYDADYDPHGDWFMKQGKRFKKHGFNVTKYCELDIDHNDEIEEDEYMDSNKRNMFLVFRKSKENLCFRINAEDKDKAMEFLSRQGVKKAFMLSTRNPFSEEVELWQLDKSISPMDFNDTTITLYGPFKREELLDVSNPISEADEDELDKYMKIARKIKGVTKVYRKGDEVVVWLS